MFGLPLVVLTFNPKNPFGSLLFSLLFLFSTYILVKRHYLLKRTTAGLLKDRKT